MLRVHIDKSLTKFLQHRELYRRIIDKSTTLTGCRQFATDDGFFSIILDIILREEVFHIVSRKVELCLDDAPLGPLFDGLRICTLTQQQSDGSEDDALAGTSLTRHHRETLVEVNIELIDKGKVLDI